MHMQKLTTVEKKTKIYRSESKVIKQRVMHFFCNPYRDNISQPHSSPMLDFNIGLYGENLRTEQSVPIDTMLKKFNHL